MLRINQISKYLFLTVFLFTFSSAIYAQLNKNFIFQQGRQQISNENFTEAVSTLNQLIRIDSTISEAWFLRGVAKYYLNDFHGAQADFSKSIQYNPIYSHAYLYRAIVFNRLSRYNLALKDFEMAIDLRPNSSEAFFSRGITHLLTQDYDRSIDDFTQTIKLQPKNVDAWINRGTARLMKNDTIEALNDYNYAVKLNPFYAESYSKRGRLYYDLREYDLALLDFNRAIQYDSSSTISLFFRALTFHLLHEDEEALNDLNNLLHTSPENALALYNRALILWRRGLLRDALNDFDRVEEINPGNILVFYNRAVLHFEMEEYNEAIIDFTSSIKLFPDFANAYLGRASAHAKLGNRYESNRDRLFAQSIAERFSNHHSHPWTDTSQIFNNLVAFNADFNPRTAIPLIEGYGKNTIDIQPYLRTIPTSKTSLIAPKVGFAPIDSLNEKIEEYGMYFSFGLLRSDSNLIAFDSLFVSPFISAFLEGIRFSREAKYNQAIASYRTALDYEPNNPLVLVNLSVELAEMVNFIFTFEKEVSQIDLNRTTRKRGRSPETTGLQLGSFEESLEILNLLEGNEFLQPLVNYNKGNIYTLSSDFESAKILYSKALAINPYIPEAWYNRGLINLMQKETDLGCSDLGKAGELGIKQAYLLIHRFCRQ